MALLIIGSLTCGIILRIISPSLTLFSATFDTSLITLLLILIGMQIGSDLTWLRQWRAHASATCIICVSTVIGSLGVAAVIAFVDPGLQIKEGLIVASGLSFYSLSSVIIDHAGLPHLALLALLANLLREVLSLAFAPFIARYFGIHAPIAATASASDSGAPVLSRVSGKETTALCVSCALALSICVPVLLEIFLHFT